MSNLVVIFVALVAVWAMAWLALDGLKPKTTLRKCQDCQRWHRAGGIYYPPAKWISNPVWEHCLECAEKRKPTP